MAFSNISSRSAKKLIEENKSNLNFAILDVHTQSEFNKGHIADAVLIDIYENGFADKIKSLGKSKIYLVYCRSGNRSLQAMKLMATLGFKQVYNLAEGLIEWNEKGLN